MTNRLLIFALGALIPVAVSANALLQPTACSLSKTYANGDRVSMKCDAMQRASCRITARVENEETTVSVPLAELGLVPGMERIQLYPVSKHEFSIAIDIQCPDEDLDRLPPQTQDVECIFRFGVVDGIPDSLGSIQVRAIPNASAYRRLDIPKRPAIR